MIKHGFWDVGGSRGARVLALLLGLGTAAGCSPADPGDLAAGEGEAVTRAEQFVVWNPGSALLNEHTQWHLGSCGQAGARVCPASGEEFFRFHRSYVDRLRDAYESQGLTDDITPWYTLPVEMRNPANGWTAALQTAETAIFSMIDPSTGARFASLETYGRYVESNYHNALHGIARNAFGENAIGPVSMSPTSTYFFKIHGLVEWLYQRFQRGDFNGDGHSDLFVRNVGNTTNQIRFMNNQATSSISFTDDMVVDACNWYVGATADLNFDGKLDLVWHGPGCSSVRVWFMNGVNVLSTANLIAQNSTWTLIGSGDFNDDLRPDLVWSNNSTKDVSVWRMNGTARIGTWTLDIPAGFTARLVGHVTENGVADLILESNPTATTKRYTVQYMGKNGVLGSRFTMSGLSSSLTPAPVGIGRFHAGSGAADLVFRNESASPSYFFGLQSQVVMGSPSYTNTASTALSSSLRIQGPR